MSRYSETATVRGWGSDPGAREVHHLTAEERAIIRSGGEVLLSGCPLYLGTDERRVVEIHGRFYTRMPMELAGGAV